MVIRVVLEYAIFEFCNQLSLFGGLIASAMQCKLCIPEKSIQNVAQLRRTLQSKVMAENRLQSWITFQQFGFGRFKELRPISLGCFWWVPKVIDICWAIVLLKNSRQVFKVRHNYLSDAYLHMCSIGMRATFQNPDALHKNFRVSLQCTFRIWPEDFVG